jgi:N-acetylated-alpha-linked acidic dipeptidase
MLRRLTLPALGAILVATNLASAGSGPDGETAGPLGFAPGSRAALAKAEAHALAVPTPENARSWLRTLTEEPHVAGTPADHKTALFVRDKLREWGWKADLVEYEVLLNYPEPSTPGVDLPNTSSRLRLVLPSRRDLPLFEEPVAGDKDSASRDAFVAFHGYGTSGEARGQVVYANYARPEDFAALEKMGIDVKGRVVLARYGELFRGLKVRNAQKRGAAGILIYSDPADDGYDKGDVYPDGPFRPGSAIQRGSVQFLSLGPGDPSTPFGPSTKDARRLPFHPSYGFPLQVIPQDEPSIDKAAWEKATGLKRDDYFATIPALPISYEAARPILEALGGPNVPGGWQGGLPFAYHAGPGPAEVELSTRMDYKLRTIWNVIATIEGDAEPDRWVMIGNHRDAWVYGAVDPGSGTAATLETCRALGSAVKRGWKPRRTLAYASWDAEEYGLVGSTEWAEDHDREVRDKVVLMINVDSAVAGADPHVGGVPSMRDLMLDALGAVDDVRTGRSLRDVWVGKKRTAWANTAPVDLPDLPSGSDDGKADRPAARFSPQMDALGSGSDYTAFVDHLGVPAVDVGFSGRYGVYHSIYDNFHWMERFGDPEFIQHATAARLYTALAMRAAGAEVVPLTYSPYAEAIRDHLDDLRRMVARKARGADPDRGKPPLAFDGLETMARALRSFEDVAAALDRATAALSARDGVPGDRLKRVNDALMKVERAFLLPDGLPGRTWFKHAIYAPGLTTGYASWPLPGLRQAILDDDAAMLSAQLSALIARLDAATQAMKDAESSARQE